MARFDVSAKAIPREDDPERTTPYAASATRASVTPPSTDPPPGGSTSEHPHVLAGRYEIMGLVGVGGMGSVYRARDTELDEVVALKMLRRELMDMPGILERFRREVKLARRVTHRNVARVFDIGEHAGDKFLTMEFIEGEPLSAEIDRVGALAVSQVISIAASVCAGLSSAHAAGVVHRDLKPDNVLLAEDERVVVTDFGIARAVLDGSAPHTIGGLVGTPAYMAPEQVEGRPDIDARADIYALGALLYELFTGKRAWVGETAFLVAAARLNNPPPDPRHRRPDLPSACAEVVLRCMARRPEDRFASAEEVAAALSVITLPQPTPWSGQRITVRPPPQPAPSPASGVELTNPIGDKTVAVLPFRNAGPPEDAYLAEELTDDLIDSLSMTKGLKVRARGAVMKWKGVERDPREIGRELEVQVVVEGSVRRARGDVRISARLISVADGFQLWARRFDRPEKDVLSINDDAADAIASALTLDRGPCSREVPTNPAAVDLYLRARHEYRQFWLENQDRAIALLAQAEALAPCDPMILSGKALAISRRAFFVGDGAHEALAVARKAVAAAPNLAEARLALGSALLQVNDVKGAVRELRQAVQRGPSLAEAHASLGRLLTELGALHEGMRFLKTALAIDAGAPLALPNLARCYALLEDWPRLAQLERERPESLTVGMRTRFVMWRRDVIGAKALIEEIKATGQVGPWRNMLEMMVDRKLPSFPLEGPIWASPVVTPTGSMQPADSRRLAFRFQIEAEVLAYYGEAEQALGKLQQSVEAGLIDLAWVDWCPLLAQVREDARFAAARAVVEQRAQEILEASRCG